MKRFCLALKRFCLASPLAFTLISYAKADTFQFTFSGFVYSGSGELTGAATTGPNPNIPTFLITSVTGTATSNPGTLTTAITSIANPGTGAQQNDNLLFFPGVNGNDFFTGQGHAFNHANRVNINLIAYSGIHETIPGRGVLPDTGPITVSSVTPEPPSIALLALPFLLLLTRRFTQGTVS